MHDAICARVLPHDGVVKRRARARIPDGGGLALVGDADGREVARPQVGAAEGLDGHTDLGGPDFLGVVLDPAGLGEELGVLLLGDGPDGALLVEDDGPGAGGPFVKGQNVRHDSLRGVGERFGGGFPWYLIHPFAMIGLAPARPRFYLFALAIGLGLAVVLQASAMMMLAWFVALRVEQVEAVNRAVSPDNKGA